MENKIIKNRDITIDVLRGVAMVLVVMGHVITGCTTGSENSIVYNVIWAVQMPLFFIISGYVTKYSSNINSGKKMLGVLKKRTIAYLLPWVVWTFLIKGLICGEHYFFNAEKLIYSMDSGYWFIFSLWMLVMFFTVSQWIANKICKYNIENHIVKNVVLTILFFGIGMVFLVAIAVIFGVDFLNIKLTLYYAPYFILGYIFGKVYEAVASLKYTKTIIDLSVAVVSLIFAYIILNVNIVKLSDGLFSVVFRVGTSVIGCIAIAGIISKLVNNGKISKCFAYIGAHSLEIYLSHYLILKATKFDFSPGCSQIAGVLLIVGIFLVTAIGSILFSYVTSKNKYLKFILFAKK